MNYSLFFFHIRNKYKHQHKIWKSINHFPLQLVSVFFSFLFNVTYTFFPQNVFPNHIQSIIIIFSCTTKNWFTIPFYLYPNPLSPIPHKVHMSSMKIGLFYLKFFLISHELVGSLNTIFVIFLNPHMIGGLPPTIHLINPINFILWYIYI